VCFPNFGGCYVVDSAATCAVGPLQGTSQSTPLVAGLAALARQYFEEGFHPSGARTPSAALLKAVLINAARNMTGTLGTGGPRLEEPPSSTQGWGRIVLDDSLYFAGESRRTRVVDVPNAGGLAAGSTFQSRFEVTDSAEPLEVTLVWTDPPGALATSRALVNDLDLTLVAPNGTLYRGNRFTADVETVTGDRQSQANPPSADTLNNVEGILLAVPDPGLYDLSVVASDVPGDPGQTTQGFALVVTGAVEDCTSAPPPAGPMAGAIGSTQVDLAWSAVPGALGYNVYRDHAPCGSPVAADVVASLPAGQTTHTDAGLAPQTTYRYSVRALMTPAGCETADSACLSVTTTDVVVLPAPPAVPDGTFGVPMVVTGFDAAAGTLDLQWDVSTCPAPDYQILYGALAEVATTTVAGAMCSLGTAGAAQWSAVPPGSVWFLVVARSGGTEGTWGENSSGQPRGGATVSGFCGSTARDNAATCP
jgi:hypothetical protein